MTDDELETLLQLTHRQIEALREDIAGADASTLQRISVNLRKLSDSALLLIEIKRRRFQEKEQKAN